MIENKEYSTLFAEAQTTIVTKDPDGNVFTIWQGQQFKFIGSDLVQLGCGGCGNPKTMAYFIDAYAHCCDDEKIWDGRLITVNGSLFVLTETLKLPPVINHYAVEMSGKHTDLFTPPWQRSIPREGGVWYTDPWHSERDA